MTLEALQEEERRLLEDNQFFLWKSMRHFEMLIHTQTRERCVLAMQQLYERHVLMKASVQSRRPLRLSTLAESQHRERESMTIKQVMARRRYMIHHKQVGRQAMLRHFELIRSQEKEYNKVMKRPNVGVATMQKKMRST